MGTLALIVGCITILLVFTHGHKGVKIKPKKED